MGTNTEWLKGTGKAERKKTFMYALKESVDEVKLAKEGKITLQSAKDFLNEIWYSGNYIL